MQEINRSTSSRQLSLSLSTTNNEMRIIGDKYIIILAFFHLYAASIHAHNQDDLERVIESELTVDSEFEIIFPEELRATKQPKNPGCCTVDEKGKKTCYKKPMSIQTCPANQGKSDQARLSGLAKPRHYELTYYLDNQDSKFDGKVKIELEFANTSNSNLNQIDIHVGEAMDLQEVTLIEQKSGKAKNHRLTDICRRGDLVEISLPKKLQLSAISAIIISFCSPFNSNFFGLYKSDESIVSQLEPMAAREAFPNFDEPNFKAPFSISIVHPSQLTALSNTRVSKVRNLGPGLTQTHFKRTPPMSSYLVGIAVGQYSRVELGTQKPILRAYNSKNAFNLGKPILEVAREAIAYMENYTTIPYVLGKLDLVSVRNFSAAAMENWGLVTFNNELIESDKPDVVNLTKLSMVTSHEIAHQWFGNLVTMNWWSEIWLNEAFADFFSYKIESNSSRKDFIQSIYFTNFQNAIISDSNATVSHPIQVSTDINKRNVHSYFNPISYNKGSSFLRMLEQLVGPNKFKLAVRAYLNANKLQNTKPEHLLKCFLDLKTPHPLDKFFQKWLNQSGFPLITVEFSSSGRKLSLKQEKFSKSENEVEKDPMLWFIPVSITFGDVTKNKSETIRLDMIEQEEKVALPSWFNRSAGTSWLMVNRGFKGFYLVRYSPEILQKLKMVQLLPNIFTTYDLLQLKFEREMLAKRAGLAPAVVKHDYFE